MIVEHGTRGRQKRVGALRALHRRDEALSQILGWVIHSNVLVGQAAHAIEPKSHQATEGQRAQRLRYRGMPDRSSPKRQTDLARALEIGLNRLRCVQVIATTG